MFFSGPEITGNQTKLKKGMGLMNLVIVQGLTPGLEAVKEQRMSNSRDVVEERNLNPETCLRDVIFSHGGSKLGSRFLSRLVWLCSTTLRCAELSVWGQGAE